MRLPKGRIDKRLATFAGTIMQALLPAQVQAEPSQPISSHALLEEVQSIRVQCETYELWTPSLQAEQATVDERVHECLARLDKLNRDTRRASQPSVSQKAEIILELEGFLRLVRYFSNNLRNAVTTGEIPRIGVSLSQTIALEQSIRLALSLVNSFETWEGKINFSLGAQNRSGEIKYLSGASASLKIDLGLNIEGLTEVQTATPRNEAGGMVELPPNSSDLFTISQIWLKIKKIRRLHFLLGIMPEFEDELAPEKWPFATLGTRVNIFSGFDWASSLLFRHDTYGIWDYESNSYRTSKIERNLTSLEWSYSPYLNAKDEIELTARFQLQWYSDPNGTLARLGLGRYDDLQPSSFGSINYRLAKIDQRTYLRFNKKLTFENFSTLFWNLDSQKHRSGRYVSIGTSYKVTGWAVAPKFYAANIQCLAVPPIGLSNLLFPNTNTRGASLNFSKSLWEKTSVNVQILAQRNSTKSLQESCPFAREDTFKPHSISEKYILSMEHSFSADTQQ